MTVELSQVRSAAARADDEVSRLKALHAQVKGALQGAYSQNQELNKQVRARVGGCWGGSAWTA